jgi:cytochrome bd-type quinol oxidase subunit 2
MNLRNNSERVFWKYYYFPYYAWRQLWTKVYKDGLDDMKAFVVVSVSELFVALILFDIVALQSDRRLSMSTLLLVLALILSVTNYFALLRPDILPQTTTLMYSQWSRRKTKVAYVAAYVIPVILSVAAFYLTLLAGRHLR